MHSRVVVVTGGGRGLGSVIVQRFAAKDRVFVLDRALRDYQCDSHTHPIVGLQVDVTDFEAVRAAANLILSRAGHIDVLINNAGTITVGPFVSQVPADWEEMIATNIKGLLNCCRIFGQTMVDQHDGRIINIASTDGHVGKIGQDSELGVVGVVAYATTKGAVITFSKALAVEWGRHGVTVNAVSPGLMRTPMTELLFQCPDKVQIYKQTLPLGCITDIDDVCETVFFLASPFASRITGQVWAVDSGYLANT